MICAAKTWDDVEREIKAAVGAGILADKRAEMPRGRNPRTGGVVEWRRERQSPADILGHCAHQNGSKNFTNPKATASYHTSPDNHITPGKPLASTCYGIMIPDVPGPAWLTADLRWITYAQGAKAAGDENKHLLPILVMGGFEDDSFRKMWTKLGPSDHQLENFDKVTQWTQAVFSYGGEGWFGHNHFGKRACPGRMLRHLTQKVRDADDKADLLTDLEWQESLLRWNPQALPKFGADGDWGDESRYWLSQFQRAHGLASTAFQDPFTELILLQRYTALLEVVNYKPKIGDAGLVKEDTDRIVIPSNNTILGFAKPNRVIVPDPPVDAKPTPKQPCKRKVKQEKVKQVTDKEDPPPIKKWRDSDW